MNYLAFSQSKIIILSGLRSYETAVTVSVDLNSVNMRSLTPLTPPRFREDNDDGEDEPPFKKSLSSVARFVVLLAMSECEM